MGSEIIRQQKRNSAVETVLTVVILLFTAIQIPMSPYFNSLPVRQQAALGALIIVFYGMALYLAVKINEDNLKEVLENTFNDEKLSSDVPK